MKPEVGELWASEESICSAHNVTYTHRIDDPDHYNWCVVPQSGQDAVLYGAIAILLGCLVSGKLSSVWIMVAGGVLEIFASEFNLRHLSNATALWMGINPPDIFLYVFLPPLLLDSAIRIDFFTFRKVASQIMTFAVLAVLGMVIVMTPLLMYAFDLNASGWHWSHAALFVCMIASTDAVAVTAVLKKANGPETLGVLMEGESLFNDATSIVLFELMLSKVKEVESGGVPDEHIMLQLSFILKSMAVLAGGGALCGLVAGYLTTKVMKLLRVRGMPEDVQVAVTVGASYLVYYVTNAPLHLSGVIAVVVYGLYGSATLKWDMGAAAAAGSFPAFWNVLGQLTNTVVFFFSGAACLNFVWRSTDELQAEGYGSALAVSLWRLPVIFLAIMAVRMLLIAAFSPMLNLLGAKLDWRGIVMCTVGGLRGALCLIMVQTVVLDIGADGGGGTGTSTQLSAVKGALALWTAGVVLGTLLINAPALTFVLRVTGLTNVSLLTLQTRDKARRQFTRFTAECVLELQKDEDELLQGVDWGQVKHLIDCTEALRELVAPGGSEDLFGGGAFPDLLPSLHSGDSSGSSADPDAPGDLDAPGTPPAAPRVVQPTSVGPQLVQASAAATAAGGTASSEPSVPEVPDVLLPAAQPFVTVQAEAANREDAASPGSGGAAEAAAAVEDPAHASLLRLSGDAARSVFRGAGAASLEAQAKQDGLPMEVVASLDEASRRKLVEKLNGHCQVSCGNDVASEAFSLTRKSSARAGGSSAAAAAMARAASASTEAARAESASVRQPLLEAATASRPSLPNDGSRHLGAPLDASRAEPYVMVLEAGAGFATPAARKGTDSDTPGRASFSGSGSAASPDVLTRAHTSPFSVPLTQRVRRLRSDRSLTIGRVQPHHVSALPQGALRRLHEEMVAEQRMRLIAGMKRYAYRKRHEGLLSSMGLRMLEHACDSSMEHPGTPIDVFGHLHADFTAGVAVWMMGGLHFRLRRALMSIRLIGFTPLRAMLTAPVRAVCRMLSLKLSDHMLLALEVAIELWLALTFSIEARIVSGDASGGEHDAAVRNTLRRELEAQKAEVWDFILDRHLEAPDRFRSIQTYRAAMALMAQQRQFIVRLYNSGMLTDAERELMEDAVEGKERALRERGAAWNPPTLTASLRSLPFLSQVSEGLFEEIVLQGRMATYRQDEVIEVADAPPGDTPFVGIILSGLATTTVAPCYTLTAQALPAATTAGADAADPARPAAFLTHGSVFGLLGALTGTAMPGRGCVVAHSEMRATHVFEISKPVIDKVRERGQGGDAACAKLMRSLVRLAATQITERFEGVLLDVVAAWLGQHGRRVAIGGEHSGEHSGETAVVRRAAERWRAKALPDAGEAPPPVNVRWVWGALHAMLSRAHVVEAAADAELALCASAVLVKGRLVAAESGAVAAAPCVLVWPEFKLPGEAKEDAEVKVHAGPEGAVMVVCDAAEETRGRRQFHTSEVVLSHLKDATGSHRLSAAQRATLGVNSAYFSQQGSMASRA